MAARERMQCCVFELIYNLQSTFVHYFVSVRQPFTCSFSNLLSLPSLIAGLGLDLRAPRCWRISRFDQPRQSAVQGPGEAGGKTTCGTCGFILVGTGLVACRGGDSWCEAGSNLSKRQVLVKSSADLIMLKTVPLIVSSSLKDHAFLRVCRLYASFNFKTCIPCLLKCRF